MEIVCKIQIIDFFYSVTKSDSKTLKFNKDTAFQSLSSSKKSLQKLNFKQASENLVIKKVQEEFYRPFSEDNNLVQKPEIEQEVKIQQPKLLNRKYKPRPVKQASLQLPQLQNTQKQEIVYKKGYVQKMKEKIDFIGEKFNVSFEKFENPAITQARQQLEKMKKPGFNIEDDESVIKDEINVTRNSDKFLQSQNRLHVMKNASSHSSSNSDKLKFQQSSSDKSSSKEKSISFKILKSVLKEKQYDEEVDLNYFSIEEEQDEICEWKLGDFIGSGSFGQVYQAMDCKTGKIFAIKKIRMIANQEDMKQLKNELSFMKRLNHNHIVKFLGYDEDKEFIYIHLEYMSQGNISQLMKRFGPLAEVTIKAYSNQILDGLLYLHKNKIVHRDIKGSNILVDSEGVVKIGDFGCSSQMEKTMTLFRTSDKNAIQQLKGSIPWMPPEVITQTKYGFPADIWSFGCTVLEMATGKIPWEEYNFDNPITAILKIGLENEIPTIPESLSEDLKDFLKICLQRDPSARPGAQSLKKHKFLI